MLHDYLVPASSTSFHMETMGMFILKVTPKCRRASSSTTDTSLSQQNEASSPAPTALEKCIVWETS